MSPANQTRLVRLTRLLHEAHEQQKYNIRRLEESYHALRTSTRLIDRRWKELECEINGNNWEYIPKDPTKMTEAETYPSEFDFTKSGCGVVFPSLPSSHTSWQLSDTGESALPRTRPRSNNLQAPRPQSPLNIQGPPGMPPPTHDIPSHDKSTPPARPNPSHDPQGPWPPSLPKTNTPTRHASLPTREYLVALAHPSDQQNFPKSSAAVHTTSPKGIMDRPPTPHPQHATIRNGDLKPSAAAKIPPPPMPPLPPGMKSYTRFHCPRVTDKIHTADGITPSMPYENLTHAPSTAHWGNPSDAEENHLSIGNGAGSRHQGSGGGRTRLQKKRRSEGVNE
ncbi:MAG: hypothetical protein Q9223_006163 [Gallowayella weberi]